jgi:ATP-dependent RNA helicase RhlB
VSDQQLSELTFTGLLLPDSLARGIADAGFERCTPIQAEALPRALAGFDVAGQAQTGTGKTAAFLVALFAKLLREPAGAERPITSPRALILAPTRELAVQIHHDAEILGQYTGLTLGLAYGGVDYDKQRRQLEAGVDVLIGTPGRIIDYFKQHVFDLRFCQVMVLDEADRMFDLGFIKDIRYLLRRLPPPDQRLNLLFSATLAQRVLELAYEHMNDPELIRIEPERITAERVRQVIYYPSMDEKAPLLVHLLRSMQATRTMIFVNTKRMAERLERKLRANGVTAAAMSGDVPQRKRLRMLREFHDGQLAALVATDVAARGLHIPDVSHVFNYDLPQDPQDYVHRIGRTARAGAAGVAVSFGCEEYVVTLPDIESFIGMRLPVAQIDPAALPRLNPSHMAPRSYGDEEGDGEARPWERKEGRGPTRGGSGGGRGPSRSGSSRSASSRGDTSRGGRGAPLSATRDGAGGAAQAEPRAAATPAANLTSPPAATHDVTSAPQGSESAEGAAPKRRRRRRRHAPGGPGGGTDQPPPAS